MNRGPRAARRRLLGPGVGALTDRGPLHRRLPVADRMEDLSREAEDDFIIRLETIADASQAIEPSALARDERVTRGVMIEEARGAASELRSRFEEFAVDPSSGNHVTFLQLVGHLVAPSAEVAANIVTKWSRIAGAFSQAADRLRQGVANGRTPPRISVEKVLGQLDGYLGSDAASGPFHDGDASS